MDNIEKDMAKKDKTKMKVRKFRNDLSEDAKNAIREIGLTERNILLRELS